MDSTEHTHTEQLLQLNRAHLRELERQAATLGIAAPSHIALQIADYQRQVAELERRLAEHLPCHNLPPRDYERFVGRQRELEEVRRLLLPYPKSRHHLVTIDGIGGIGKSALALETAYAFRERYAALPEAERFDAIVWVSAKRTYLTADGILERRQAFRTLDDLYAAIAQVLDYPAITRAPAAEQRAIVEQVLGEQRTLLILDNLETVDDEELLVFLRLLPDPTKAIVTTRHRIDVAYPVRLTGMPHADALALIAQEAARKEVALTPDEQEALWQRTGGVPLAIVWSIGLMGLGGSVESVLRRLGQGQSDIARFCFEESVAQIRGRDAHRLLLALSLFASDASREALGIVAGLGEDEFGRDMGLEELLRLSLVNKEGERFSLLPLTRSFVQVEAVKQTEWMESAQERWTAYFYKLAGSFGWWSVGADGQDRVEQEIVNVFAALERVISSLRYSRSDEEDYVIEPHSTEYAHDVVNTLLRVARTCRVRGFWIDCERLCHMCITIGKALNDYNVVGWAYYQLSNLSDQRNNNDPLFLYATESYKASQQSGNQQLLIMAERALGVANLRMGKVAEATVFFTSAMQLCEQLHDNMLQRHLFAGMASIARASGDLEVAERWYQRAIKTFEETNSLPNLSYHLLMLGRQKNDKGDIAEAKEYYAASLKYARECKAPNLIALALHSIASFELAQNQPMSAEANARQALDLFRRLGMKREQAEAEALLAGLNAEA